MTLQAPLASALQTSSKLSCRTMRLSVLDTLCGPAAGLAMALDVLIFGGRYKLYASAALGQVARMDILLGSDSYKVLPSWVLGRGVLLESLFFPKRAVMMNGPFVITCRGGCPSPIQMLSERPMLGMDSSSHFWSAHRCFSRHQSRSSCRCLVKCHESVY